MGFPVYHLEQGMRGLILFKFPQGEKFEYGEGGKGRHGDFVRGQGIENRLTFIERGARRNSRGYPVICSQEVIHLTAASRADLSSSS